MTAFRDITGHRKAIAFLRRAILADRVSHAYLICSDAGSQNAALAQAFAAALQCSTLDRLLHTPSFERDDAGAGARRPMADSLPDTPRISPDAVDSCGRCSSCLRAADGNHPDLITWTHEKPKTFSVEDARRLVADVQIRPFESARKIYLIPDAHLMTTEAQNTLLKTLEEPPEYVTLLLLADSADRMLETIRSRCVLVDLEPGMPAISEEALQCAMHILLHVRDWNIREILDAMEELSAQKQEIEGCLDLFTSWYRDLLYRKAGGEEDGLLHAEYAQEIARAAEKSSYEGIRSVLDALQTARLRLKANVNFDLTMEFLLLAMREN